MYLVWITNLSMNIIQTSQIKSNKMMVEKLLEKSKEKKYEEKPISCFFRTFSDTSYCCFIHENLPNIIMILEFFLFAPFICFVLFVDHFQSSIECFLSKMNSLSITHFFFLYRFTMQFRESRNNRSSNENNKNIWIVSIRSLNK